MGDTDEGAPPLEYTCAFCGDGVLDDDPCFMVIRVSRNGTRALQEFFAHRDCVGGAIHRDVPLGEVFDGFTRSASED